MGFWEKWWDAEWKKEAEDAKAREALRAVDAFQATRENLCFAAWWEAYKEALRGAAQRSLTPAGASDWALEAAQHAELHYRERSLRRDRYVSDLYAMPQRFQDGPPNSTEEPTTLPTINLKTLKRRVGLAKP